MIEPSSHNTSIPSPSFLALHGFTGCGQDFDALAQACGGHWHCPDLPGHRSQREAPDCSPAATLAYLQRSAAELPAPRILLGYSMGARAALQLALAQPGHWQALILISAQPGIECQAERAARRASDAKLAARCEQLGLPAFLDFWQRLPMIRSQANIPAELRAPMQAHRLQHSAAGLARSLRQFSQGHCPDLWPQLDQLSCPTLCLSGENDLKYHQLALRIAQAQPRIRHITIPQVGHMPQLEALADTAAAIRNFVAELGL